IDPSDLLKTGMIITTYNDHVKAPSFPVLLCLQTKNTVSDGAFAFIQSILCGERGFGLCARSKGWVFHERRLNTASSRSLLSPSPPASNRDNCSTSKAPATPTKPRFTGLR